MKHTLFTISFCLVLSICGHAQDILGNWKTFSSRTGEARSIVNVYEENGKIYGKVMEVMNAEKKNKVCDKCEGSDKDQKIEGLVLMKDFIKDGDAYVDGTITNPNDGNVYRSKLWLDTTDKNTLHVRGYVGLFYKTMAWKRVVN